MKKNKLIQLAAAFAASLSLAALTACDDKDDTLGEKVDEAGDEIGDAVEEAADEVEDATD